jgi:hypothetical protein
MNNDLCFPEALVRLLPQLYRRQPFPLDLNTTAEFNTNQAEHPSTLFLP